MKDFSNSGSKKKKGFSTSRSGSIKNEEFSTFDSKQRIGNELINFIDKLSKLNKKMYKWETVKEKKGIYEDYQVQIDGIQDLLLEYIHTSTTETLFYEQVNNVLFGMIENLIEKIPEIPGDNKILFQEEPYVSFMNDFNQVKSEIYQMAPALEWLPYIDNYDVFKEEREEREKNGEIDIEVKNPRQEVKKLLNEQSRAQLYEGAQEEGKEDTTARKAFALYLEKRMKEVEQIDTKPRPTIKMKDLLLEEGLILYKEAINEERRSRAFRDAVFLKSTQEYDGPKWKKKLILWVGGPSSSGKTYAAKQAVKKMSRNMEIKTDVNDQVIEGENYVVSVDGGIEREVSQMRQLVLQVALSKGYKGIKDLHKNTKLKTKEYVKAAALMQEDLGIVIPETFAESVTKEALNDFLKQNEILYYHKNENMTQAFAEVTCEPNNEKRKAFKIAVWHMGSSRAWLDETKSFTAKDIKINNRKIGCESKIYDWKGFKIGKHASKTARDFIKGINPDGFYIRITNDLMFVNKKNGIWEECGFDDTPELKISRRDFETWQQLFNQDDTTPDLKEWYKSLEDNNGLAPILIEMTRNNSMEIDIDPTTFEQDDLEDNELHLPNDEEQPKKQNTKRKRLLMSEDSQKSSNITIEIIPNTGQSQKKSNNFSNKDKKMKN
ncbi:MAG: hypothetical protein BGO43_07445 [Gammaproteobacteria bacterium 39-13]|nr:hypothetical protein [Gammaproteobacteria bacterium]OJV91409.1 MAG: hypothetical protein BGO43_07445 [Gammaproteobacteria bacterium 39-13]